MKNTLKDNKILIIGLGQMGYHMACNLVDAGYVVTGYDINEKAVEALADRGGRRSSSIAAAVEATDIVATVLVSDVTARVTEQDILPHVREGQVYIEFGTAPASQTRRFASAFAKQGVTALDVPVSGGWQGARDARLQMFVGGDEPTASALWPIFEILGDPDWITYAGEAGQGQCLKVVQQLRDRLLDCARLEIIGFGVKAGLDLPTIARGLKTSLDGDDPYARLLKSIDAGQTDEMGFVFGEWPYYLDEADKRGYVMPVLRALFEHAKDGPMVNKDGQGRPGPSIWQELMRERSHEAGVE
jgi:2-hydroxy-3-oxopropionate reductase